MNLLIDHGKDFDYKELMRVDVSYPGKPYNGCLVVPLGPTETNSGG